MGINKSCFEESMDIVMNILNESNISDKKNRIDRITNIYNKMLKEKNPDREFYSLAHEIKGYDFINSFGDASLSNDEKHKAGPDITFGKYRIECVCCSEGSILDAGYAEYSIIHTRKKTKIINYNKTREFLLPRLTNSLITKKEKIVYNYIENNIIKFDEYPIIFISLGELNIDFHSGTYAENFLEILIGKGPLTYVFDRESKKLIDCYWQKNETIKKNNGNELVDVPANFFNNGNKKISGIIFSTANIYEKYTLNNTFLFLNPYAENQIDINDFKNIIYWRCNEKNEYIPMKNNVNLSEDLIKTIF